MLLFDGTNFFHFFHCHASDGHQAGVYYHYVMPMKKNSFDAQSLYIIKFYLPLEKGVF